MSLLDQKILWFDNPISTVKWFELRIGSGPLFHLAVAVIIAAVGIYWFGYNDQTCFWLALAGLIGWPVREMWQHKPRMMEVIHHPQSFFEWFVPQLVTVVLFAAYFTF